MKNSLLIYAIICLWGMSSCKGDLEDIPYNPTPYNISPEITENLGILPIPSDNPLTEEGLKLGQHLFYDPMLSSTGTMSCSSCHLPEKAFTDGLPFSTGVDGIAGTRSSMSLVNAAYYTKGLFWDGRESTLESQALLPVEDDIELNHNWDEVIEKLKESDNYSTMFREAFGIEDTDEITKELAAKALSQLERIIISGNSKYDRWKADKAVFSDEELFGYETFFDVNPLLKDGECGHCHNEPLFTSNQYFDNGIQDAATLSDYKDIGLGMVTSKDSDYGKFRAPTLRNIELTAPYMHDGRFETLEDVINHYDCGSHGTPNQDPLVHNLMLTEDQKTGLLAFMKALTDTSYLENPYLENPFE